jgi:EAL domain-containing protein (putative c-di-GMP-specific phosphodiesterase class I)
MTDDDQDRAVTQSIIDLGHRLHLTVLAEGIESDETWTLLQILGCDEGQGYFLARPMPAEKIEGWITAHQHQHGDNATGVTAITPPTTEQLRT